jgi:pimeloyl-ACP methyl ester carboxylesterase
MKTMDSLGYRKVIATGHSNGGIWISDYKAITQDPRIVGMVYMAPTANVKTWEERKADPKIMAEYEEAKAAVERGQGTAKVFGVQSAILVYDSHRPEALSHPERMAQFSIPGLAIIGGRDNLFSSPVVLDRMRKAYRGKFDVIRYTNGTHGLRESKEILASDIDTWVKNTFLN